MDYLKKKNGIRESIKKLLSEVEEMNKEFPMEEHRLMIANFKMALQYSDLVDAKIGRKIGKRTNNQAI